MNNRDLALAQELSTTWEGIFEKPLQSQSIEEVRSAGIELARIAERLDTSNGRWKVGTLLAFIAGVAISHLPLEQNGKVEEEFKKTIPGEKVDSVKPTTNAPAVQTPNNQ